MANQQKTYFLAPTWDYPPPPVGPLRLGNIISKPDKPTSTIYSTPSSHVLASANDAQALQICNGYRTQKTGLGWTRGGESAKSFGVWTEFLSFLGLGVDLGVGKNKSTEEQYTFEMMTTIAFTPTQDFLQATLANDSITYYFEGFLRPPPLYIITSIKFVSGAKCKSWLSKSKSLEHSIGVDATALGGVPVSFGPEMIISDCRSEETSFEGSDDFVFAYSVRKLKIKRTRVEAEDYNKGALYDLGSGPPRKSNISYDFDGFEDEEFVGKAVEDEHGGVVHVAQPES